MPFRCCVLHIRLQSSLVLASLMPHVLASNFFKGGYIGGIIGVLKGDSGSLDDSSHERSNATGV